MTPEKVKQYKITLGLLGIHVEPYGITHIQYKISKHNTGSYTVVFHDDYIYKMSGGTYIELREEEVDEIIQKYVAAKGKYND